MYSEVSWVNLDHGHVHDSVYVLS